MIFQAVESTLPMFDATVSIVLTGKRSTPVSAPTTVAVSLEVLDPAMKMFLNF